MPNQVICPVTYNRIANPAEESTAKERKTPTRFVWPAYLRRTCGSLGRCAQELGPFHKTIWCGGFPQRYIYVLA